MDARCVVPARDTGRFALLAMGILPFLTGASFRSANFAVDAPSREVAQRVAERAEACRTGIAQAWLGHDLPTWSTPCPIRVKLTDGEAGGLTSFGFNQGRVTDQSMTVEGRLDRILASALPHEVTHTIFASYFGGPMPRWADEGASLLSEDDRERRRHDKIALDLLARRGEIPLARLFRDRGLSQGPDELLRSGLFDLTLPDRDGRTPALPAVRPRRSQRRLGPRDPHSLPARERPRARPRLALVAPRHAPGTSANVPRNASWLLQPSESCAIYGSTN